MVNPFPVNNSHLRITTRYDNIYTYDVEVSTQLSENGTKYKLIGGYAVEVFHEIIQIFGFSYELVPEVKMVEYAKTSDYNIDIFLGSFAIRDRGEAEFVQTSFITGYSKIVAFIDHRFEASENNPLLDPFDSKLRIWLLLFIVLFSIAISIFGWFENFATSESIFNSVAILTNKSTNLDSKRISSRVAMWTICIAVSIIWTSYSGTLVSTLAVARYAVNSLESLLTSHYSLLLENGYIDGSSSSKGSVQSIAEGLPNVQVLSNLLHKAKDSGFTFDTFDKAIMKVNDTPSAYVIDEETGISSITNTIGYFPCTWDKISVYSIKYPWCMYLGKKSPNKSKINLGLLKLSEFGVLKRIQKRCIPSFLGCRGSATPKVPSLGYQQLHSAFYIFYFGFATAFMIFLILERQVLVILYVKIAVKLKCCSKRAHKSVQQEYSNNFKIKF